MIKEIDILKLSHGDGTRHDHYKRSEIANIHNILFTLNSYQSGAINITLKDGLYSINSPFSESL